MPLDEYRSANLANWDDRVPIHLSSDEYAVAQFVEDQTHISGVVDFDRALLGEVAGRRLLHLQCHFGMDTLSWARLGAEVTGVDFSEVAINEARRLSEQSGVPGRFIVAELYDTPRVLDERFDVVYTGVGALNWLPDAKGWAEVVDHFLAPGGIFFMREGHPMLLSLSWREDDMLVVGHPYFETAEPIVDDAERSYAGEGTIEHSRTYEWNHGLGEIVSALFDVGLRISALREHRELEFQGLPNMVIGDDGRWRLPDRQRDLVPLMYTLMAEKPLGQT